MAAHIKVLCNFRKIFSQKSGIDSKEENHETNHLFVLFVAMPATLAAQGINVPARTIIDLPNASLLPNASFDVTMRIFPEGGLLTGVNVGLNERFMIGLAYGGTNVIGKGAVNWHPFAGAAARYRIISESFSLPGIAIGFDSQGHGAYVDSLKRFERKSPGFTRFRAKTIVCLRDSAYIWAQTIRLKTKTKIAA